MGLALKKKATVLLRWNPVTAPNGHDCDQLDYIIINGKYKRFLLHTRMMKGTNTNSDHHLLLARVKVKLCSAKREKRGGRRLYNTAKLRDHAE